MRRSRRVTLHDVAREAGVSRTTASYVLNGRSAEMRISDSVDQRVREIAGRVGYRPNRNAASLRTQRTRAIGVITDYVAGGMFSSRILVGAGVGARALDHVLVIGESQGDLEVEQALVHEMVDRQVDGVLYVTRAASQVRLPSGLEGVKVVTVNCVDPASSASSVMPDDRGGGYLAADTLLAAGVEQLALVGEETTPEVVAGVERVAGVRARLDEEGLGAPVRIDCDWSVEAAFEAVESWLASGGRAEGLVCLNDRVAMGAYQALAEHRLRVPHDVSVVSFDGTDVARWLRPRVASVGIPFFRMGEEAVRLLLDPGVKGSMVLAMPLVPGESVRDLARSAR